MRGSDEIDSVALNIDFVAALGQTREELSDYLGHPELILYYNTQRFDNSKFSSDSIVSESRIWNQHIDKRQANWMQTFLYSHEVQDTVDFVDIG